MSTLAHEAALEDIRDSCKWLGQVLEGLSVEALNWTPWPDGNSIAVLVRHALPSAVFWARAGSGLNPSHRLYTDTERTPAFEATDADEAALRALIARSVRDIESALAAGTEAHLALQITMDDEPHERPLSGAYCLVHAAAHLREHAGQAALTRDLLTPQPPLHASGERGSQGGV